MRVEVLAVGFFLVVNIGVSFANSKNESNPKTRIDSLYVKYEQSDLLVAKDFILNELFWEYYDLNYDSAMSIAKRELALINSFDIDCYNTQLLRTVAKRIVEILYSRSCNNLAVAYECKGKFDTAIQYYSEALKVAEKANHPMNIATIIENIGVSYEYQGKYPKALEHYFRALNIYVENREIGQMTSLVSNIGLVYFYLGDIQKAADYFYKSIQIARHTGDELGTAYAMGNLGMVYCEQKEYSKALGLYTKSLNIAEKHKNYYEIQMLLSNIGQIYSDKGELKKAEIKLTEARRIAEGAGFVKETGTIYSKLGSVYFKEERMDSSEYYLKKAFEIHSQTSERNSLAGVCNELGELYVAAGENSKALEFYHKSLQVSRQIRSHELMKESALGLSKVYKTMGNLNEALRYSGFSNRIIDSLNNEKTRVELSQIQAVYDFDRKQYELKLKHAKERLWHEAKIKEQQIFIYIAFVSFVIAVVVVFLIYRGYTHKRKQKDEIQKQRDQLAHQNNQITQKNEEILTQRTEIEKSNKLIKQKNKNITDSIKYAKRIQNTILPTKAIVDEILWKYFIYYKPKDIVSGDFYWIEEKGQKIFVAAVDCTGHGVPGAFMSIISNNLLNKALNEESITNPGEILESVSKGLYTGLKRETQSGVKDGMDIALCSIDKNTKELVYSGVQNPVLIIRNREVIQIKASRQAIGTPKNGSFVVYPEEKYQLKENDVVYLFTDGYYDQFGGPLDRKFMKKRFRELLKAISTLPLEKQKDRLDEIFINWKAQGTAEQIDDVLVIGIKIE